MCPSPTNSCGHWGLTAAAVNAASGSGMQIIRPVDQQLTVVGFVALRGMACRFL